MNNECLLFNVYFKILKVDCGVVTFLYAVESTTTLEHLVLPALFLIFQIKIRIKKKIQLKKI